uniref:Peptidase M12A domain-containing protein n=1 Tax=Echinostoma caproni TaxID=27848 RepID=A0A183ASY3_9TREM
LLRDDYKLIQWRTGLFNNAAKMNARATFSDAETSFARHFRKVVMPIDMREGCYSFDDHEMQIAVLKMLNPDCFDQLIQKKRCLKQFGNPRRNLVHNGHGRRFFSEIGVSRPNLACNVLDESSPNYAFQHGRSF